VNNVGLERARREELRWLLMMGLHAARPVGTSETILRSAIIPVIPDLTLLEIRKELDYLADRGLVALDKMSSPLWFAKLNHHGIDIVEYTVDCLPGIARPRQW